MKKLLIGIAASSLVIGTVVHFLKPAQAEGDVAAASAGSRVPASADALGERSPTVDSAFPDASGDAGFAAVAAANKAAPEPIVEIAGDGAARVGDESSETIREDGREVPMASSSSGSRGKNYPTRDNEWTEPANSHFKGRVLDYRVVELPPREKGEKPGELREWLIEPEEGYTAHIEEEYRPNAKGELQIVDLKEYVANQVLLTLDGEVSFDDFKAELEAKGAVVKPPLMELEKGAKIVAVMVPEISFDSVETLRDTVAQCDPQLDVETDPIRTIERVPNDARYSSQWGLPKIQAPEAWNIRTDASSVIVAVIDTGVNYNHQDLSANMWVRNSSASVSNFKYGMRASQGIISGDPLDDHGHGSHCAGIIGAVGNNSTGISGVAWTARIMACKNLFRTSDGNASGSGSDMILCMEWARTNGAHIVSLSQGGGSYSSTELAAFQRLRSAGIIAVCAAGNSGANNETTPHYPSSYSVDNIVAVAATTSSDTLASFSCYGATSVDIGAPGVGILSTINVSGSYDSWNGTSMATPFVSGSLALLKAHFPSYTYLQLIQKLYAGGDALSALSGKCTTGKRLNIYKAISVAQLVSPTPTASCGTYSDRVAVSWPSVSGATHYRVYRATSSTGAKTALGSGWQTATSYTDSSVPANTTYYYWVLAATSSAGANQSEFGAYAIGYAVPQTGDSWDNGDDTPSGGTTITPTTSRQTHGTHTLSATDKYDFFKISMSAGTTYTFETTGTMDTYGELFSAASTNSSNRVAYDDDSGTDTNFKITYTPTTSGTHYLRIRAYSVGNSGSYTLEYQRSAASDSWDPGDNTPSGGTLLTPTTTIQTHGPHSLSSSDLYDFFRISMTAGRTYVFESTGSYDMYGELFNSTSTNAANRVAYNDDGGTNTNFRLEYTPTASQTYYLRVRRYSVGSDGSYSLSYSYSLPAAAQDLVFCNHMGWPDSALLTASTNTMASTSSFQSGQTVWICYQWFEAEAQAVEGPITNCAKIVNTTTGATCYTWTGIFSNGVGANRFFDVEWDVPGLEPGAYTVRLALNEDENGRHSVSESTYTNNVRSFSFTVANPQKTLTSIAISGNASIASKGYADYRCIGTYSDGTTDDVSPTWTITSGSSYATVNSSGRVTAGDTTTDREIVLRAAYDGKTATKTIAITDDPTLEPFPEVVSYPSAPMIVEGIVYINDVLATDRDKFAAFSGEECRGKAQIGADGRVTFGVSVLEAGEAISFKVWDASEGDHGTILNCLQTLAATSDPQGTASSPIRFDAASADPFGRVSPEPLVPPTIIEASVSVDGAPASSGDILAVFAGETIVGKAPISFSGQNGNASATCRPVMFFSGSKALTFKLWDADNEAILDSDSTLTVSAGDVVGTVDSPYAIAFVSSHDDDPCPVSLKTGWNLVSFSVLPESPTPANVFAPVSSSVQYVSDVSGNLWGPTIGNNGLSALRLGAGYWVRSSADNVNWDVEGRGNPDTEIALAQGWNLVGYTLPRAGLVANVLRTALMSGKVQYVTDQSGNVYPGGSLSSLRPGVGYWVRATSAYTLKFDRDGMASAADAESIMSGDESPSHPFGTPAVRMGVPTIFENMGVSVFGKAAAFGDYLAVFDRATDELVSVQPVNSEDGTLTFTIMGLRTNDKFYFKVWNAASGLESPTIFASAQADDLTISNPADPIVGYGVAIQGTKPTYTVRYDLGGKATRTGGGALSQSVAFGGDAVDPVISVNDGWRFVGWDYSKRTDIRSNMVFTAMFEETQAAAANGNLCFVAPNGWPAAAFLASSGNSVSAQTSFSTIQQPYLNFAFKNSGSADITGSFQISVTLKNSAGTRIDGWNYNISNGVQVNATGGATDEEFNISLDPGTYTVGIALDSGNAISESNESDNAFTITFTVENSPGLTFTTGGDADWFMESYETYAGSDTAFQSGDITSNEETILYATGAAGQGIISFYWKISSEVGYDWVEFYVDGVMKFGRSGIQDWRYEAFKVGAGNHTFAWRYVKDGSYYDGEDCAWVDQVVWTPNSPLSPVYRFYSRVYKGHFFTMNEGEMVDLIENNPNWDYEGVAYFAYQNSLDGTTPLYRFYSKKYRGHFFTRDYSEYYTVRTTNPNWKYEGEAFYIRSYSGAGSTPIYRFWSKAYSHHFYTASYNEMWTLRMSNPNWEYEGIAFYAWATPDSLANQSYSAAAVSEDENVGWTLEAMPFGVKIEQDVPVYAGDALIEAQIAKPAETENAAEDYFGEGVAEFRFSLPAGVFTAQLWRGDTELRDELVVEDAFEFSLPASGEWHRLCVLDGEGLEVFATWLRAKSLDIP